jgi:hypothetical protein
MTSDVISVLVKYHFLKTVYMKTSLTPIIWYKVKKISEEPGLSLTTLKMEAAESFETFGLFNQTYKASRCIKPQCEYESLLFIFSYFTTLPQTI